MLVLRRSHFIPRFVGACDRADESISRRGFVESEEIFLQIRCMSSAQRSRGAQNLVSTDQTRGIQASTAKMTKTSEAMLLGQGILIIRKAGRIV